MTSLYDLDAPMPGGTLQPMGDYRGKVVLIVNTASKCGFTPQYEGLEELYRDYKDRGFEILAFPCNQFGAQEPGDAEEIANFCSLTYDVSFPLHIAEAGVARQPRRQPRLGVGAQLRCLGIAIACQTGQYGLARRCHKAAALRDY